MPKPKNEPIFEEPEFNEKDFLTYEKERAKSTIVVFFLALGSGLLEGYLDISGYDYLSILLFIVLLVALFKILGFLHLTLPPKNSHKFYMLMVFLLASILFWSIALNPPLSVNTSPEITMEIQHNGNWYKVNETNGKFVLAVGPANYSLRNVIYFNANVTLVSITPSVSSGIISHSYLNKTIFMNIKDLGNLASLTLVTELRSGNKFYNETQDIAFVSS